MCLRSRGLRFERRTNFFVKRLSRARDQTPNVLRNLKYLLGITRDGLRNVSIERAFLRLSNLVRLRTFLGLDGSIRRHPTRMALKELFCLGR